MSIVSSDFCPLFRGIDENDLTTLLSCLRAQEKSYQKGDYIFWEGQIIHQVGIVLTGKVMVEMNDVWGNNSVLSSVSSGETFGESYACIPREPLLVNILATEDTQVLFLDLAAGLSPCASVCTCHAQFIRNLMTVCAQKNLQLSRRILHTQPKSIRKKLLSYFSQCAKQGGSYSFTLPFNRQQLSDYLNVDRSALCSELSAMQQDGILVYHKNQIQLTPSSQL